MDTSAGSPGQLPLSGLCAVRTPAEGILCAWSKCRRTFAPGRPSQVFCSGSCRVAHWREQRPLVTPTHIRQRESGSIWRAIYDLMAAEPGRWWSIQELAEAVGALPASVSTRIRTEVKRHAQANGFRLLRDHLVGHAGEGHRFSLKREAA